MTRNHRTIIQLSLRVLRVAVDRQPEAEGDVAALRLALRCLAPWLKEKWPLTNFWTHAFSHYDVGRRQGVSASYNAVLRQLQVAGIEVDDLDPHRPTGRGRVGPSAVVEPESPASA